MLVRAGHWQSRATGGGVAQGEAGGRRGSCSRVPVACYKWEVKRGAVNKKKWSPGLHPRAETRDTRDVSAGRAVYLTLVLSPNVTIVLKRILNVVECWQSLYSIVV